MSRYPNSRTFSLTALRVFERAARYGNFSRTADDLSISQSSVSRYIADIERRLAVRLFERNRQRVEVNEAGEAFYAHVRRALEHIEDAVAMVTTLAGDNRLVIACGHAFSQLFMKRRFDALQQTLGQDVYLCVLTCDYDMLSQLGPEDADLVFGYGDGGSAPENRVKIYRELVGPICSPEFAAAHADILSRPVAEWGSLPFLSFARPSRGWATWDDWFDAVGHPRLKVRYRNYFDYAYLIDAAVAGHGLGVGNWHLVDHLTDTGALVNPAGGFVEINSDFYLRLTDRGVERPLARRCLDFFVP